MKRFTSVLVLLLMAAMPMMAERVDPEKARKVAQTFLNNNGAKSSQLTDLSKEAGFDNLYIFNAEQGFVIIAADDCVKPVLGYSLTGRFVVEGIPENILKWLEGYNEVIQHAMKNDLKATTETAQLWKELTESKTDIGEVVEIVPALVKTQWSQGSPYNNSCPGVTGCVATAMAQIMKYWNFPGHGIGSHSYTWNNQNLTADFASTSYDWEHMINSYSGTSTEVEKQAVATLMFHCGVSVNMGYGWNESSASTFDVVSALKSYFNYSPDISYENRSDYNDSDWIALLKAELDNRRPIQYRGSKNSKGGGHSFICDGYNSNDLFHFNWGWGGRDDGFFDIDIMGTSMGSYTIGQAAIIGIHPATIGDAEAPSITAELVQATNIRNAQLTWTTVSNATSYQLYCNTKLIYSGTETSYIHEHIPYGTNTYFVRSVDASGNLSWPSNYEDINITFAAPTNLTAEQTDDGISLSWTHAENAVAYNVYCNGVFIASNITTTTYIDSRTIAGTLCYYVKGIDELGDDSDPSEATTINVDYKSPTVEDLAIAFSDNNATLTWNAPNWCYPETASESLFYGSGNYSNCLGYGGSASMCWGHRYLASELESYNGLVIYKVSFYVGEIGTYQCMVYKGTETYTTNETQNIRPITQVANVSITTSQTGWIDIDLGETIDIDASQDLWVFMLDPEYKGFPGSFCNFADHNEGCYYTNNDPITNRLETYPGIAWLIKTCLTDGVYTYHLYDNGTSIADNIMATGYTITSPTNNTVHQYTLKTKHYGGGESTASNMAGIALGSASLNSLELGENDKLTLTDGCTLTVSGDVTNANPDNLILENGAQLIHNSANVQATVKKTIAPYTANDNGWNFIASPVTESITPSVENGLIANEYDLYYYDEPTHYWRNYVSHSADFNIDHKKGYLYANGTETTLQFEGTLAPSNAAVSITGLSHSAETLNGFNLVGNPFACNASVDQDCYIIDGGSITLAEESPTLAPCEGVMVKADSDQFTMTFSKASGSNSKANSKGKSLDLVVTQGKSTLDRARVRLGEGIGLEKYSLDDQHSQISLLQNGQDYAVVYTDGQSELPLNFKALENGTYSIGIEHNNLYVDYLHLIDNMTGADVDLLATPSYSFEGKANDYESRFKLVFSNYEDANDDNVHFAYYADGEIRLVETCHGASLQVVDMMGRVVLAGDAMNRVSTNEMTAGVYVLRLINGNDVKTQKIVIE